AGPTDSHIQRPVAAKGKAARPLFQLHGRDPEVRQDSIRGGKILEHPLAIREVLLRKRHAIAETREPPPRERERVRIAIERQQPDLRPPLEKSFRVPAGPDRRVHEEPAALRREELHDLLEEDRRVLPLPNVFRLSSPFLS